MPFRGGKGLTLGCQGCLGDSNSTFPPENRGSALVRERRGLGTSDLRVVLDSPLLSSAKAQRQMTKDGFLMYLLSADGSAFSLAHRRVYQDMNQPLSHYLVSSSHNTYLLEDQITGPSSTEAYIR